MTPFQPNPDHTIDTVLHGLRDAEAPTGLEARILHNLQQRALATPAPANLWTRLAPWRWSIAVALPAMAILILALTHKARIIPVNPTSVAVNSTTPHLAPATNRVPQGSLLRPGFQENPRPTPTSYTLQSKPELSPQLSPQDQLALEEANAPSLAPPTMPLTSQERLLIRVTRPGSAIEVAELDQVREPILRAAAAARDRASLERYATGIIAPLLAFHPNEPTPDIPQPAPDPTTEPQPQASSK